MAWALFALGGAPSAHATGPVAGVSGSGAATGEAIVGDVADGGAVRADSARPLGVSGARVADAGNLGAYHLVPGANVPYAIAADPLPHTVDGDGSNQSGATAWNMGAVPVRSVPEPSELALLGDGLLVLIAWLAGRQARRSRSMAAMTDRDEH